MLETGFLRDVASHYLSRGSDALLEQTFVFPSKRSRTFFLRYLSELAAIEGKTILAPRCTTVNEFILGLNHRIQSIDRTELLFKLYNHYVPLLGSGAEDFGSFLFWGDIILKDFDQIDRCLVDAYQLYDNTSALKELDDLDYSYLTDELKEAIATYWKDFKAKSKGSEYREKFLEFWNNLGELYVSFTRACIAEGVGYEGLIYRDVIHNATDIVDSLVSKHESTISRKICPYVFVGLFELSKSEHKLFRRLADRKLAEFVWDEDVCVIQDTQHMAHRLMARNKAELSGVRYKTLQASKPTDFLPKQISVYNCTSTVAEVKILPYLLSRYKQEQDVDAITHTAIVLPDEQLLLPVVSSIPTSYSDLNITLGYPLNKTSIAIFINRWMALLSSSYRGAFIIPTLINLLSNQILLRYYPALALVTELLRRQRNYMLDGTWIVRTLIERIKKNINQDQQAQEELASVRRFLVKLLLLSDDAGRREEPTAQAFLRDYVRPLLEMIITPMVREASAEGADSEDNQLANGLVHIDFDLNFLKHYEDFTIRLEGLIERYEQTTLSLEHTMHLLDGLTQGHTIPFRGNPLKGLQIIGVLESRSLHFEHLIYLSAQEGKLPKAKSVQTFIPYKLRQAFGLPTTEEQDAYEAYRFYQTIAKAKSLSLIYSQSDSFGGKGELTRYLAQIEKLYAQETSINIDYVSVSSVAGDKGGMTQRVAKAGNPLVTSRFAEWTSGVRQLSASALNMYLQCPLRFYYECIEDLREESSVDSLLQSSDFGTILHSTMQRLYGKLDTVCGDLINSYLTNVHKLEDEVRSTYREYYKSGGIAERIMSEYDEYNVKVISRYVRDILDHDKKYAPFGYLYSEANMRLAVEIESGREVHFKGFIDRIDGVGGIRIVDYKTGGDNLLPISIEKMREKPGDYKAIIQTLLYCEMVYSGKRVLEDGSMEYIANENEIYPALYITRLLSKNPEAYNPYFYELKGNNSLAYSDVREEYISFLKDVLVKIFDLSGSFEPCKDTKLCQYCPFTRICRR